MAYVSYSGLATPNEVITKMSQYISGLSLPIAQTLVDDVNIYDQSSTDGKKFAFKNMTNEYTIMLRSANGTQIFGTTSDADMDVTTPDTDSDYTGVGMIVGESYSPSQRWYNQYKIPVTLSGGNNKTVLGVFMPMKVGSGYSYTLYCNHITTNAETILFSLVKEDDTWKQTTHLVFSYLYKYENWTGGAMFSGSSVPSMMKYDVRVFVRDDLENCKYVLPILSSGSVSNTFLRININDAPSSIRGNIWWASSGIDNPTGKKLSLPYRVTDSNNNSGNGRIVSYKYLQSTSRLDSGKNVNTLNCLTVDMPIFASVLIDPDVLDQYAAAGDVSGVYFVSLYNMQTGSTYERNYPSSNVRNQVFPLAGRRRGHYGFDGIAIAQDL